MKNKKTIKIVLIVLCILIVVSLLGYGVYTVIDKNNKEKNENRKRQKEIVSNFEAFKEAALAFGNESIEYRTWIKDDINENTAISYDGWLLSLDTMTKAVDDMEKVAPIFKKNCINKKYSNKDVEEKCNSFITTYEEIMNTYVVDVEDFNEKINALLEKNDKLEIKTYELKYKKVDLNKDNNYSEIIMEEVEETEEE